MLLDHLLHELLVVARRGDERAPQVARAVLLQVLGVLRVRDIHL